MKMHSAEVKSESKVVATVDVPEFETLSEAVTALSEATCLGLINTQNATNIKNVARASFNTKPSKKKILSAIIGSGDYISDPLFIAASQEPDAAARTVRVSAYFDARVDAEYKKIESVKADSTTPEDEA